MKRLEPMSRLMLQVAQNHRHRRMPEGDNCLISGMGDDRRRRREIGCIGLPLIGQRLKASSKRGRIKCTDRCHKTEPPLGRKSSNIVYAIAVMTTRTKR